MHALPELFRHPTWEPSAADASASVHTPLGEIGFAATVDGHPLRLDAASAYRAAGGARLWVWDGGVFRAELLRCRPAYRLPPGMTVRGCEAAMWRLTAAERPAECAVICRWIGSTEHDPGAPESGEGLESQLWSERGQRVSVGTPDIGEAVHYLTDGFVVSAPLAAGAAFQTQFVIAWSTEAASDAATWFAVRCTPDQVLAGVTAPSSGEPG